jgi:cyclopropane-fatty-acyl-phospholipid synthase
MSVVSVRDRATNASWTATGGIARIVESTLGTDLPVAFAGYDGSRLGPTDPQATVVVRSSDALQRMLFSPGELGVARAFVAGDIDVEGDIFSVFELRHLARQLSIWRDLPAAMRCVVEILRLLDRSKLRPLPRPAEEARPRGQLHSRARDAAAIAHHYNVGNEFYRLVLGPSMTYSCAVWDRDSCEGRHDLESAQRNKYELICGKLGLRPGMRLLDVGCGWGGMVRHAARHYGVESVGVTLSGEQATWARAVVEADGLADQIEIRLQDYRDISDGPFDAVSSIGMFEHVGRAGLGEYFSRLHDLLVPGGRLLNHAISRPPQRRERVARNSFMARYIFPDGELIEVGSVISEMQAKGFEARHMEDLREHYALTLRAWVANLEANWDEAVRLVGSTRARVWRLYLAGCAVHFEDAHIQVNQVLGVKLDDGRASMPLRPDW